MSVFSTNQVRQFYVANSLATSVDNASAVGAILPKADTAKTTLSFLQKGAGGVVSSDKIDIANIISVKATRYDAIKLPKESYKVVLDSSVNGGAPISGQDYILRLAFQAPCSLSQEQQEFKYGMVHAVSGMTASAFYTKLALSIVKNMAREVTQLVDVYLLTSSSNTKVTSATTEASLTGTYVGIQIEAAAQPWRLGLYPLAPIHFACQPTTVVSAGDEVIWGTVSVIAPIGTEDISGKMIADLEYFCMGFRGDFYRNMGFPHSLQTTYLVDPDKAYCTIDIHYSYVGSNESVQKSEKTITIAVPADGSTVANKVALTNSIITKINSVAGTTIPALATT